MRNISIIVAVAENNAIGINNQLLWHLSDDLKRFKKLTTGHRIIMGRNTYLSLPVRPLPNRTNIVISDIPGEDFEGCTTVGSIDEVIKLTDDGQESFIIGGGSVYKQFLPMANKLYLTKVHKSFEGDTFFPEIDESKWKLIERIDHEVDEKHEMPFSFLTYIK
jgi:dihydrofolate reductase